MTKKRSKLKQLFLFNGLLLLVAFILIQYSVNRHTDDEPVTAEETAQTVASQEETVQSIYKEVMQGSFLDRLQTINDPELPYNIPFKTLLGRDMTLDDLKGQWVVLNFWASWCPPCIQEMPSLQQLQDEYGGQGLKVVAIGLDREMDGVQLRQVMQRYRFGPVAAYYGDWPTIKPHFEIDALPTTYILSPDGHTIAKLSGHTDWVGIGAKSYIERMINRE